MNERHAALLDLELFAEELQHMPDKRGEALDCIKRMCVFTTHTPVPAGHDQFSPWGFPWRPVSNEPRRWAEVIRHSIALTASFFNTQRVLTEYLVYTDRGR